MNGDEERIRQGGCEAYLSKPISIAKFMETVRRLLSIAEAESAIAPSAPLSRPT